MQTIPDDSPGQTPTLAAPDAEQLSTRLRLAVTRLARRLRQEGDAGISPSMTAALASIDQHGSLSPSELAEVERIQRPTATRAIANLEAAGLILRASDPSDGRVTRVRASAEGRRLLRRIRTRKNAYIARRLRRLDADELATLERAAAILERMLEDPR